MMPDILENSKNILENGNDTQIYIYFNMLMIVPDIYLHLHIFADYIFATFRKLDDASPT